MFIVFIIILFLIILFLGILYTIRILSKAKLRASLKKNIKTGSKQDAIDALLNIIKKHPLDNKNRMDLINIYIEEKKFPEAISHLNYIFTYGQKQPDFNEPEINKLLAECYLEMNNLDEALKVFTLLRRNNPGDAYPYFQLGKIEKKRGAIESASQYFIKASSLDPENEEIIKAIGLVFYESKKYPEALTTLHIILKKNPADPEINYYVGEIRVELKQYQEAFNHYLKSKNDPLYMAGSLLNIGKILHYFNKLDDAHKVFTALMKIPGLERDHKLEAMYELGEVCLSQKDIQKAIVLWEKIVSITSEYKDVKAKLEQYEETKSSSMLRAYMMTSQSDFMNICKKIVQNYAKNAIIIRSEHQPDLSVEIFSQAVCNDVSTTILFKFFRGASNIGQLTVREFYEKMKETKAKQGVCITTTEYSPEAFTFCEGRVLELLEVKELVKILSKIEN